MHQNAVKCTFLQVQTPRKPNKTVEIIRAHNPKVARSSRVPATPENSRFSIKKASILEAFFALVLQIGVTKILIYQNKNFFFR
jgi:hypothetical protein